MIKGSIQQEDVTTVNIYASNIGATQCMGQMPTTVQEEINSNTVIVEDFNIPLIPVDRSMQTENKETHVLIDTLA